MVTKEELSDKINEALHLEGEIDFSKMTKEDLEKLLEVLGNPSGLIQIGIKNLRAKARKEILERPLREFLEKPIIEDILAGEKGKGGLLGLGILPHILRKREESKE